MWLVVVPLGVVIVLAAVAITVAVAILRKTKRKRKVEPLAEEGHDAISGIIAVESIDDLDMTDAISLVPITKGMPSCTCTCTHTHTHTHVHLL